MKKVEGEFFSNGGREWKRTGINRWQTRNNLATGEVPHVPKKKNERFSYAPEKGRTQSANWQWKPHQSNKKPERGGPQQWGKEGGKTHRGNEGKILVGPVFNRKVQADKGD